MDVVCSTCRFWVPRTESKISGRCMKHRRLHNQMADSTCEDWQIENEKADPYQIGDPYEKAS